MASKSPQAFRTIGEASEAIGVPQHVLRFWETRFPQLQPLKRGGNRRYYRPDDMALLAAIKTMLHGEGLTIRGAQLALARRGKADDAVVPAAETGSAPEPDAADDAAARGATIAMVHREALLAIRNRLASALAR